MTPYYESESGVLYHGDCLEVMKQMPDNSVTSVLTDPPYGLGEIKNLSEVLTDWLAGGNASANKKDFMGKEWELPSPVIWKEVFRILKPGGTALVFAGTRSFDLMAISMRLAGFEIKDSIWHGYSSFIGYCYGSGFPKAADVGKQIDRKLGKEREVVGTKKYSYPDSDRPSIKSIGHGKTGNNIANPGGFISSDILMTAPATPESQKFEGYKSALKPALEPIILAMKPNDGTYAENALKWGVSGLNINSCRIGIEKEDDALRTRNNTSTIGGDGKYNGGAGVGTSSQSSGRYPSNLLLSHHPECVCEGEEKIKTDTCTIDQIGLGRDGNHSNGIYGQKASKITTAYADSEGKETIDKWTCHPDCIVGQMNQRAGIKKNGGKKDCERLKKDTLLLNTNCYGRYKETINVEKTGGESGYVSRYFKQFAFDPERLLYSGKSSRKERNLGCEGLEKGNTGPCVKPISIMEYLSLLTRNPDGGIVFDPFAGSGSTLVAAINTNRRWIGIERESEYCAIASCRISYAEKQHKQTEFDFKETENEK
jgi:site-specific DNA-methyltransferase (adenine-specific)